MFCMLLMTACDGGGDRRDATLLTVASVLVLVGVVAVVAFAIAHRRL
jgi:hypothetical protein